MESRKSADYMMYYSGYPACCYYCLTQGTSHAHHRTPSAIPREEARTNFSMESILASGPATPSHLRDGERHAEVYARERDQEEALRAHYLRHSSALDRFHPYRAYYDYSLKERLGVDTQDDYEDEKGNKRKRTRTIFTAEQLATLEREFERQQYMVGAQRQYLAVALNLTENQVKIWFQNRRIKWRKQALNIS